MLNDSYQQVNLFILKLRVSRLLSRYEFATKKYSAKEQFLFTLATALVVLLTVGALCWLQVASTRPAQAPPTNYEYCVDTGQLIPHYE